MHNATCDSGMLKNNNEDIMGARYMCKTCLIWTSAAHVLAITTAKKVESLVELDMSS